MPRIKKLDQDLKFLAFTLTRLELVDDRLHHKVSPQRRMYIH